MEDSLPNGSLNRPSSRKPRLRLPVWSQAVLIAAAWALIVNFWLEMASPSLAFYSRTRITHPVCAGGGPVGVTWFDPGDGDLHAATIDRAGAVSELIVDRLPQAPHDLTVKTAGQEGFMLAARSPADRLRVYRFAPGSTGPITPVLADLPDWTADTGFSIELQAAAAADKVGVVLRGSGIIERTTGQVRQFLLVFKGGHTVALDGRIPQAYSTVRRGIRPSATQ
jgi:hypothetical protein